MEDRDPIKLAKQLAKFPGGGGQEMLTAEARRQREQLERLRQQHEARVERRNEGAGDE